MWTLKGLSSQKSTNNWNWKQTLFWRQGWFIANLVLMTDRQTHRPTDRLTDKPRSRCFCSKHKKTNQAGLEAEVTIKTVLSRGPWFISVETKTIVDDGSSLTIGSDTFSFFGWTIFDKNHLYNKQIFSAYC